MYTGRPVYATIRRIGVMPHKWKSLLTGIQGERTNRNEQSENFWILLVFTDGNCTWRFYRDLASDIPWLT